MSKVVTTTLLPDVAGGSVTLGGTGDSVVVTGNDIRTNALQDAGGNAVFTSDGSGTLSGMNSALRGALNLLSTQTASGATSVSFTTQLTSTYDVYIFKFIDVNPATQATDFSFQVNASGQTGYNETMTTTYFQSYHEEGDTAAGIQYQTARDQAQGTAYQKLANHIGNGSDESCAGELYLFSPASTTYVKHFYAKMNGYYNDGSNSYTQNNFPTGYINTTSAITEIDFKMSSGNFDGTIKLYGISKS